jgi:NADPH:quinone reductase
VKRLTDNRGVDVVYDSIGKTTFEKSLSSVRLREMRVLFEQTSGPIPAIDPGVLKAKGSLFLTRPTIPHYISTREELLSRAGDVLNWVASGELRPHIDSGNRLAEVATAHRRLESRKTVGKLVLGAEDPKLIYVNSFLGRLPLAQRYPSSSPSTRYCAEHRVW